MSKDAVFNKLRRVRPAKLAAAVYLIAVVTVLFISVPQFTKVAFVMLAFVALVLSVVASLCVLFEGESDDR